jgi:hypothetical protein
LLTVMKFVESDYDPVRNLWGNESINTYKVCR